MEWRSRAGGRGRPTPFVVFTTPRSGSSWLIDLLDSHPRIAAYAELFLVGDRTTPDYGSRDVPRFEATLDEPRRYGRATLLTRRIRYLPPSTRSSPTRRRSPAVYFGRAAATSCPT